MILVTNDLRLTTGMMDQSASKHPPVEALIFVLDDNTFVFEALRLTLKGSGYKVVCFTDETRLFRRMQRHSPNCIFLDVDLPGRSGLEILRDLAAYPASVIVMSEKGDIPMAVNAIRNGAVDFIQKPFFHEEILKKLASLTTSEPRSKSGAPSFSSPGKGALSYRERQIVRLLVAGRNAKQTGLTLGISPRTVEDHLARIRRKLGMKNSAELVKTVLTKPY